MEEFRRLKANKIWNRKTFKKLFKFGNLRIYITWNLRLKARNKRDDIFGCLKTPRLRRKLWERAQGKCERCGKDIDYNVCELHHVLPLGRFKEFADDINNMQCLCHDCHKDIHCNPFLEAKLIRERCNELGLNIEDYYGNTSKD